MITSESISVSGSEPGFVHVQHRQLRDSGVDMGGPLWFGKDNLPWVIETLRECLGTYGFPGAEAQRGGDSFKIFESGPEQAPIVNIQNRRAKDGTHGGMFALLMSRPIAEELLHELQRLQPAGG